MPHTLLLADDSVTIQRVIELTFADEDIRVVAVSSGDEAIEVLNRAPPDIVLADVGMPGPSGYDIAQYMKERPPLADIPVVLLTGAFEPVDQARADAAGCDGVLAKPFEPQLVIGRVKELLARAKHASAPAPAPAAPQVVPPAVSEPPSWDSALDDQAVVAGDGAAAAPVDDMSDYFDRIDLALAKSGAEQTPASRPKTGEAEDDWLGLTSLTNETPFADTWDPPSSPDPVDRSSTPEPAPIISGRAPDPGGAPLVPAARPEPEPIRDAVPSAPALPSEVPLRTVPSPQVPSSQVPALADAFAALLSAEQDGRRSSTAPVWPAGPMPASLPPDLVEQVTRGVIDRLADHEVRDMIREIVTATAERLVREEIERIKSIIK